MIVHLLGKGYISRLPEVISVICAQNLRQQILELLGPISMNHGAHFMAAIAYVWNERKQVKTPVRNKVGVVQNIKASHMFE